MIADTSARVPARMPELDILRGIAIAAVIMIHEAWDYAFAAGMERQAGRAAVALHLTSCFAVPLFIMLSAIGLSIGYGRRMSAGEYADFLRRRALRLLPAFVVWSLISIAAFKPHVFGSPLQLVRFVLYGHADAQFYFIPLIFELYVLWPVFQPLAPACARSRIAAFAIATTGVIFSAWWWQFTAGKPQLQTPRFFLLIYVLYVCLGIAAAPQLPLLRRLASRPMAVAAVGVLTAVTASARYDVFVTKAALSSFQPPGVYWASIIFTLPSTAFIVCASCMGALLANRYPDALGRFFLPLGRHSYGIYLVHYFVLRLVVYRAWEPAALATASTVHVVATVVVGWLACIAVSTALVATASRFSVTRPLVSNRW